MTEQTTNHKTDWADAVVRRLLLRYTHLQTGEREARIAYSFEAAAEYLRGQCEPRDKVEVTL